VIVFDPVTHGRQIIAVKGEPTRDRQALSIVFTKVKAPLDATSGTPGSSCVFLAGPINPCVTPGFPSGGQITTHSHFTDNIFRVGLNYQFH
jgi:hypothetical protein